MLRLFLEKFTTSIVIYYSLKEKNYEYILVTINTDTLVCVCVKRVYLYASKN